MTNDAARHELEDVLARVHQQMTGLAAAQREQAAMTATAAVADGTIEVTVDARGAVIKTMVDDSYLEDYDFGDLGDYVTAAAQAAAADVRQRIAALMAPLRQRRAELPALSEIAEGAPDLRSLYDDLAAAAPQSSNTGDNDRWEESSDYPTIRS